MMHDVDDYYNNENSQNSIIEGIIENGDGIDVVRRKV